MPERNKTAYITGGASGIGRALSLHLLSKNWHVFIADRDVGAAQKFADEYNPTTGPAPGHPTLHYAECDTTSWTSQLAAFRKALDVLDGRLDFIAPIAGIAERKWLPFPSETLTSDEFSKPDLSVIDVDLTGVLYTIALGVQQFRRQDAVAWEGGWTGKGKIGLVASICGIYCVPSLPVYTAAKHAIVGLTRSYGALLVAEGITVNAVAPNVVRTAISSGVFYDLLEREGLLTPMEGLIDAFGEIATGGGSGEVFECGPKGGYRKRDGVEYLDDESERCCGLLLERAKPLHYN
ncbi:hypothetical protein BKA66DRAFT_172149 [Pyrenochaeta sp. MPI-SDFR-AT-0127]|nr:hypothetical protein BKA66DRAFT_172149 [Pyrenochaeta sp. MPI-SDFR-AT-0127]